MYCTAFRWIWFTSWIDGINWRMSRNIFGSSTENKHHSSRWPLVEVNIYLDDDVASVDRKLASTSLRFDRRFAYRTDRDVLEIVQSHDITDTARLSLNSPGFISIRALNNAISLSVQRRWLAFIPRSKISNIIAPNVLMVLMKSLSMYAEKSGVNINLCSPSNSVNQLTRMVSKAPRKNRMFKLETLDPIGVYHVERDKSDRLARFAGRMCSIWTCGEYSRTESSTANWPRPMLNHNSDHHSKRLTTSLRDRLRPLKSRSYHRICPDRWILIDFHLNLLEGADTELQMSTDNHLSDVIHFFSFDIGQQFLLIEQHRREFAHHFSMHFGGQGRWQRLTMLKKTLGKERRRG